MALCVGVKGEGHEAGDRLSQLVLGLHATNTISLSQPKTSNQPNTSVTLTLTTPLSLPCLMSPSSPPSAGPAAASCHLLYP